MPGAPVPFTKRTAILVAGLSGAGKSTLLTHLAGDKIKIFHADHVFQLPVLEEHGCDQSTEFFNYIKERPQIDTYIDIAAGVMCEHENIVEQVCQFLHMYILKSFKPDEGGYIVALEGFIFSQKVVAKRLLQMLAESDIMTWYVVPGNEIQTVV